MSDICNLIVAAVLTTQGCAKGPECLESTDGRKVLCTPMRQIACPTPPAFYDCRRSDGSTYQTPALPK